MLACAILYFAILCCTILCSSLLLPSSLAQLLPSCPGPEDPGDAHGRTRLGILVTADRLG
eukprot:6134159-Heterocapsa_arctica.AAC.1